MPVNHELRSDGVCVVERLGLRFTVFIPSRKRADIVMGHPLFDVANIMVHEGERDEYARTFDEAGRWPGSLLVHSEVGRLARIRNLMLNRFDPKSEAFQIQTDDDVRSLRYTYRRQLTKLADRTTLEPFLDTCVREAIPAMDVPTGLFFFQQSPRPQERDSLTPFALRRWGRADVVGIIDPELRFDENLLDCEDMDISLQCIAKHRVLWMDMRYFVICYTPEGGRGRGATLPGGSAGVSTRDTVTESYRYLARKWGSDVIEIGKGMKRGQGYNVRVNIPQRFEKRVGV